MRKLAGAEKFFHGCGHRLGVDHFLRHQTFCLRLGQAFLDSTLYAYETDTESVFGHFANTTDTTVAEMIDVVDGAITIANVDQRPQDVEDVVVVQDADSLGCITTNAAIELHASDS